MHNRLHIKLSAKPTPLVSKAVALLQRRLLEAHGLQADVTDHGCHELFLDLRPGGKPEGYRIETGNGGAIHIIGHDERGLLYGIGKFLRAARFQPGHVPPAVAPAASAPEKEIRGVYLATHFFTSYHAAPVETIRRYIEDLALWGCNALWVWYDMSHFHGIHDPKARAMIERLRLLLQAAHDTGMMLGLSFLANEAYANSPVDRRGKCPGAYGVELCPSKPGAADLLLQWREEMFKAFAGLDFAHVVLWPYEPGGCQCAQCAPWGTNGFVRMAKAIAPMARRYFPKARLVLSTWGFDWPEDRGEWAELARQFAKKPDWTDMLLADSTGDFPEYPLKHGVPGHLPLLNFSEISMHGMYPWGGFGANPFPARLQRLWNTVGGHIVGGFAASEGLYEDMNKAIALQYYWDGQRQAGDILREYLAYEFSPAAADDLLKAVELMELNLEHKWVATSDTRKRLAMLASPNAALECEAKVHRAEAHLDPAVKTSWRWRVFRLRAALDAEFARTDGMENETINRILHELTTVYGMSETARHAPSMKTIAGQAGAPLSQG